MDVNLDHAAWLVDVDAVFGETEFVCSHCCGAASCTGSFGVAGAAFPDLDVEIAGVNLTADLEVHPLRKFIGVFHIWSKFSGCFFTYLIHKDDTMWITDRQTGCLVIFVVEGKVLIDNLTHLASHWNLSGKEGCLSHVYTKFCGTAVQALHFNRTGQSFDLKFFLFDIFMVKKVFCKNTDTISADRRFASVRVVDMHAHFSIDVHRSVQNAVCTESKTSLTHQSNLFALKLYTVLVRIQYQIIISKSLIFYHCNAVCHCYALPLDLLILWIYRYPQFI